jgi:AcrR family transcriptional regulator
MRMHGVTHRRRAPARRSPGRPRAGEGVDTREALLRNALALFAARGFAGVTVGEIATAAEVTVPVIYQRFGSKAELFVAVAEDAYDRGLRHLEAAISGVSSFDDTIDAVLEAFASLNRLDRHTTAMGLIVVAEARRYGELSAELRPTLLRVSAFFDEIAKLAPPDVAPDSRARCDLSRALISMCGGLASAAMMIDDAGDYERIVDAMRSLIGTRPRMPASTPQPNAVTRPGRSLERSSGIS